MTEPNNLSWKEKKQAAARDEIKQTALAILDEGGFENLSMHNIARHLQTTTPALYYYFKSRDDLLNELSADALADLQTALRSVRTNHQNEMLIRQAYVIVAEYYNWARHNPTQYQLLFANPLPGYRLPESLAVQARQTLSVFLKICEQANLAGMLAIPVLALTPEMRQELEAYADSMQIVLPPEVIFSALTGWAKLQGLLSQEIHGGLLGIFSNLDRTFFLETRHLLEQIGFDFSRTI